MSSVKVIGFALEINVVPYKARKPSLKVAPTIYQHFSRPKNYTAAVTYLQF